jgi:branched-chain amino acid aminotransferase
VEIRSDMPEETQAVPVPRPIAWMDGRVVPASEATVPLLDDGFLRGDAVFDAVLIRDGRTHALDAHLARLRRSAKIVGIRVPVLRQVVSDLLVAWGDRDGSMKLIVTRGGALRGIIQPLANPPSIALQPIEMPWRTVLTGAKTLSYAVNVWASRQARLAHADEALILGEDGTVFEAPTAAIVWIDDGGVFTPDPGDLPILDSISVRELEAVVQITRGEYHVDDVLRADEVFIISASRPVLPVHAIDETTYPAPGPRTREIRDAYGAHILEVLDPGT